MKKLFLFIVMAFVVSTAFPQENLKVVKYILLEAEQKRKTELELFKVPENEVWRIESALSEDETEYVTLVINEVGYIIGLYDANDRRHPNLPFYLPGGTEFKLGAKENVGIVSICVLKIE
jgi:hypothetical protein